MIETFDFRELSDRPLVTFRRPFLSRFLLTLCSLTLCLSLSSLLTKAALKYHRPQGYNFTQRRLSASPTDAKEPVVRQGSLSASTGDGRGSSVVKAPIIHPLFPPPKPTDLKKGTLCKILKQLVILFSL